MLSEKESFTGVVEKITYKNEVNAYTVAEVSNGKDSITVVGTMPLISEGDTAEFFGRYIVHPTYGRQFSAEIAERKAPQNSAGILRYLSAGAIKGIGPATAAKIVKKFGEDSLDIIKDNPSALATISGISLEKANAISEDYNRQYGVRDIMLMLSKYKISPDKCLKIYRQFGEKAVELIKSNPYILCEEGIDIRFETAEEIAEDESVSKESELRIAAGIEYVLKKNLYNGHTCLPREKFIPVAARLLDCKEDTVDICCDRLCECMRISSAVKDGKEFLSIPRYNFAERHIAARLKSVKQYIGTDVTVDELEIERVENSLGIKFEKLQKDAILEAFKNGILILTGGPGTGKTTTLNAIIRLFEGRNFETQLAAPTGRAAKRMSEVTGKNAKTIHRLLEVEWGDGDKQSFARNEKNPLECDVIIVDEASMIDVLLFDDLLKALKASCRIILVGDSDQLPSIGAGNVLGDILASDVFPSIRLKKVFRQASQSKIISNAHSIIDGEKADFSDKQSDCFFLHRADKYSVVSTVSELFCDRLKSAYGINPLESVQVLCPSRMSDTGTVNLNNVLQEKINPQKKGSPQLFYKGFFIRVGDRVMQIKNNYDLGFQKDDGEYGTGVFNGDIGFVTEIDVRAGFLKVRYDDRVATYFSDDIGELELAFAVTVHKSQGSEYDYVILPLMDVPQKLQYRNLLYTAVTRAKKMLIVVGSEEIWYRMAENDKKTLRYTMLEDFLKAQQSEHFGGIC